MATHKLRKNTAVQYPHFVEQGKHKYSYVHNKVNPISPQPRNTKYLKRNEGNPCTLGILQNIDFLLSPNHDIFRSNFRHNIWYVMYSFDLESLWIFCLVWMKMNELLPKVGKCVVWGKFWRKRRVNVTSQRMKWGIKAGDVRPSKGFYFCLIYFYECIVV